MMPRWCVRTLLVAVLLSSNLVYLESLKGQFIWDDHNLVVKNEAIRDLAHPATLFTRPSSTSHRFVTNASLALDYACWRLDPWGYHLTNLLLHGLATLLFAGLAYGLFGSPWVAFLAGLIFSLHPARAEAVAALLGRSDLLCTVFVLLAFLCHLRLRSRAEVWRLPSDRSLSRTRTCPRIGSGASSGPDPGSGIRGQLWQLGVLLAYGLAMGSKETGMMVFPLLVAYDRLVDLPAGRRSGRFWRERGPYYALLALLALAYLYFRFWVPLPSPPAPARDLALWEQYQSWHPSQALLTSFYLVAHYLGLLFFPWRLSNWYEIPRLAVPWDPRFLGSAALLLALLGAALYAGKRERRLSFLVAWFLLFLLPVLNLAAIPGAILAERWLYLAGGSFCLLLGYGAVRGLRAPWMGRHWSLRPAGVALVALVLALYAHQAREKSASWRTAVSLFAYSLQAYPDSAYLHFNLATAYYVEAKDTERTVAELERAIQCDPRYLSLLTTLSATPTSPPGAAPAGP
ncbi:MAG: hypothetical protein HYY20_00925 [Candidatus Tectomicrobia bacterium]|uniref:Tetratricopeptide repeat protein n=1 Tax=Tectimicrobiota bacterium TaxID=2528274 RepID=A0A932CLK6_UNCTE|nr:hypothetical protein [Candidatus Tectomicrobia bacterium]